MSAHQTIRISTTLKAQMNKWCQAQKFPPTLKQVAEMGIRAVLEDRVVPENRAQSLEPDDEDKIHGILKLTR